jgi:hypothetical protein
MTSIKGSFLVLVIEGARGRWKSVMKVIENMIDFYKGKSVELAAVTFLNHRGFNPFGNPTFKAWVEDKVKIIMAEQDINYDRIFHDRPKIDEKKGKYI